LRKALQSLLAAIDLPENPELALIGRVCGVMGAIFRKHTLNGVEVITQSKKGMDNFFAAMFLTTILHLYFKIDCLEQAGYLPPTQQDVRNEQGDERTQISTDPARPTAHLAIAILMARINDKLALFWKIPKHWLATVSDYLHRLFTPSVRDIFNKRALSY